MSSETLMVAVLILVAVIVGAAVPVLIQLRSTLREAQRFLAGTGRELEGLLGQARNIGSEVERGAHSVSVSLAQAERSLRVLLAVVPAAAAALGAIAHGDGQTERQPAGGDG